MTYSYSPREKLGQLQTELAKQDPTLLEIDLDDPDTVLGFVLYAALLKGNDISLESTDDDGRTETVSLSGLGQNSSGESLVALSITSSDGTLSPDTADMAAQLLQPQLDAEINGIIEQR